MAILNGIVTVLLVITALILIVTVLLQPGESNGLGAIAGGAETFFGKNKAKSMEGKLCSGDEGIRRCVYHLRTHCCDDRLSESERG